MQILNPVTAKLFIPLFLSFSILLGLGLIAVLVGMTLVKDAIIKKQLIVRWLSWAVITPIAMFATLSGPLSFSLLSALVSVICVCEFSQITNRKIAERIILILAAALMPLAAGLAGQTFALLAIAVWVLLLAVSQNKSESFEYTSVTLVALAYVPCLASYAVYLYKIPQIGPSLLISIITASALANIVAFAFGKMLAGPKLAPLISPNKTWWGVAGSICGAYLGFLLLAAATQLQIELWLAIAIPLVVAIAGVLGDLFESFLKRSFNVKDAGNWLPGFGGALDRVDGLLFVLPCVYYLIAATL